MCVCALAWVCIVELMVLLLSVCVCVLKLGDRCRENRKANNFCPSVCEWRQFGCVCVWILGIHVLKILIVLQLKPKICDQ